ncbi:hypothetical protein B566_EDAN019250 [Ephemera danica]|nr:hypothetical protein B566_EDAN019250 [Ephemera danica]
MPKEVFDKHYTFLPHASLLSFEEITRLAGVFTRLGVHKFRLTGGEPLLRKHIEVLISMLAALRTPDGQPLDLTLTTNGTLLKRKAQALKDAGLKRVTVSLDALDDAIFQRMNDVGFPVADVLEGIAEAERVGLAPLKALDGQWDVRITGAQGSGILRSMSVANGMVVLHHGQGNVAAGELVDVWPFEGLI